MPFVEGESLRDRLTRVGELPVAEAVRLLREIATALAYAHEKGLVHRDIKPENVLLSGGIALVADFGVAKALIASATAADGGLTSVGVSIGTPAYMSPEQVAADPNVDHRADLYALGMVAYEMLAGQAPFAGRPVQALLSAHITDKPEPLEKRRPAVPPALAALVMKCLEKRPRIGRRARSRSSKRSTRWLSHRRQVPLSLTRIARRIVDARRSSGAARGRGSGRRGCRRRRVASLRPRARAADPVRFAFARRAVRESHRRSTPRVRRRHRGRRLGAHSRAVWVG
jgi:serine/threonine protein kinase